MSIVEEELEKLDVEVANGILLDKVKFCLESAKIDEKEYSRISGLPLERVVELVSLDGSTRKPTRLKRHELQALCATSCTPIDLIFGVDKLEKKLAPQQAVAKEFEAIAKLNPHLGELYTCESAAAQQPRNIDIMRSLLVLHYLEGCLAKYQ
jgi:hypothetical protein